VSSAEEEELAEWFAEIFCFIGVLQLEADDRLQRKRSGCCVRIPGIFRFSLNVHKLILNFRVLLPFPKRLPLNLFENDKHSCEICKNRDM